MISVGRSALSQNARQTVFINLLGSAICVLLIYFLVPDHIVQFGYTLILLLIGSLLYVYRYHPVTLISLVPIVFFVLPLTLWLFGLNYGSYEFLKTYSRFTPRPYTVSVYILGFVSMFLAFVLGKSDLVRSSDENTKTYPYPILIWLLYTATIIANLAAIWSVGDIPLLNIASRWGTDPKLVFIVYWQGFFLAMLATHLHISGNRDYYTPWLLIISVTLTGLLGARNTPVKILLVYTITRFLLTPPKRRTAILVTGFTLLIVAMTVVGLLSKSAIYGIPFTAGLALAQGIVPPLEAFYNLEKVILASGFWGHYHGQLTWDSILAGIPGTTAVYANYIIGDLVHARRKIMIGSQLIVMKAQSVTSTIFGPMYAEFGLPGVLLTMFFLGLLLKKLYVLTRRDVRYAPLLGLLGTVIIYGTYGSIYLADSIYSLGLILAAVLYAKVVHDVLHSTSSDNHRCSSDD